MQVIEEEPIKAKTAKEVLSKRDKEEMTYEQRMALEASKKQDKSKEIDDEEALIEELEDLNIRRLKERTIYKLIEILPRTMTEIRTVTSDTDLRDKELEEILEIIRDHIKEE